MTDRETIPELHRSVFTKLLAVMVAMALVIPALVGAFFVLVVGPTLGRSIGGVLEDYVDLVATTAPDLAAARALADRAEIAIRYEGPAGAWTTDDTLPSIAAARGGATAGGPGRSACGKDCWVVTRADGGAYLFVWSAHRRALAAHDRMALVLVAVLVAIVVAAHEVLRRTLQPLKLLRDGVARLAEGDLDVAVPRRAPDELGLLTDAFNRMVERVREMIRSRDQLLLDVSHELRSPLTRIKVALALFPEDAQRRRIERYVEELEAMIADLLEQERLRAGRGLRLGRHDLVALVRAAVEESADRPPGVRLGPHPAEAWLELDPDRVRTVVDNLLENALKFALPDSGPVEIAIAPRDGVVELRVEDDGPGIADEDLPRLFEPFYRADRSRSRRTGGYGLGLSLCRRIVEAHGGRITVERRAGRGACFVVTLPASAAAPHADARRRSGLAGPVPR
jgi:signal transduction histidine kinase